MNAEREQPLSDISLDKRLDRVEAALNETRNTLARVVALMDGNKDYRIIGIPDQLAAYIKANEDWKKATETRIINFENRLSSTEEGSRRIFITPPVALLLVLIGALCLVVAYIALTWLQSTG